MTKIKSAALGNGLFARVRLPKYNEVQWVQQGQKTRPSLIPLVPGVNNPVSEWENKLVDTVSEDKMTANETNCPAKDAGRKSYGKCQMRMIQRMFRTRRHIPLFAFALSATLGIQSARAETVEAFSRLAGW